MSSPWPAILCLLRNPWPWTRKRDGHLSIVDTNRGSRSSTGDLDDSVFEAKSISNLVSSLVKYRRSLGKGKKDEVESEVVVEQPRPCSSAPPSSAISASGPPHTTAPFKSSVPNSLSLPPDVVDIDLEDDSMLEYGPEMAAYLAERERMFVLEPGYLDQGSITPDMRAVLVDWLLQVQHYLKLSQETMYLGVSLLDSILSQRDVEPDKLQLVGITALYLGSKMDEYYPADIKKLLHLTEDSYNADDLFNMELVILGVVCFQVYVPTPMDFLPRLCRAALRSNCPEFLKTCCYLTDCHLPRTSHPTRLPSHLAAAAVLSASLLYYVSANTEESSLELELVWTPTLRHYSGYTIEKVCLFAT